MHENNKERVVVEIYGQYYTMKGESSSSHMRMVAGYVDDKMRKIASANPRLDTNKLAVLSALNMADEYFKLRQEYEELLKLLEQTAFDDVDEKNENAQLESKTDKE
nr:cell division protein ZapA [Aneurinibacillus terranovensis]